MSEKRFLKPVAFMLAVVILMTSFTIPVFAACKHKFASGGSSHYVSCTATHDKFQNTKKCTKCHKNITTYTTTPHVWTGGTFKHFYGQNVNYEYYEIYQRCTRYNSCHRMKKIKTVKENHSWKRIKKMSNNKYKYKCTKCNIETIKNGIMC